MSKLSEELAIEDGFYEDDISEEDYGFIFDSTGKLKSVFLPDNLPFNTPENIQKILEIFGYSDPEQLMDLDNNTLH
jgi:hypothetical protein